MPVASDATSPPVRYQVARIDSPAVAQGRVRQVVGARRLRRRRGAAATSSPDVPGVIGVARSRLSARRTTGGGGETLRGSARGTRCAISGGALARSHAMLRQPERDAGAEVVGQDPAHRLVVAAGESGSRGRKPPGGVSGPKRRQPSAGRRPSRRRRCRARQRRVGEAAAVTALSSVGGLGAVQNAQRGAAASGPSGVGDDRAVGHAVRAASPRRARAITASTRGSSMIASR